MELEDNGLLDGNQTYNFFDRLCCINSFKLVFCVGNHMLSWLEQLIDQDVVSDRPIGRPRSTLFFVLKQWIEDYFNFNCEKTT
jgi:hypothetical protein